MVKLLPSLFLLSVIFSSCEESSQASQTFFDSLVISQINNLSATKASLSKTGSMEGKTDLVHFIPTRIEWENELDVFRQLRSFDKPGYQSVYEFHDKVNDAGSNLLIRSYQARKALPVPLLKFYYYQNFQNLKKIEAIYQESNLLFASSRKLSMEFNDIAGNPELINFTIEGNQKMIGRDSIHFLITSSIHHSMH